jgi:hypothetical protein
MVLLARRAFLLALMAGLSMAQAPPQPPPPPRFMSMRGMPLSCFDKPNFEEAGLEFFVCNGGGGIAGVRKKQDPAQTILVRDPDIAENLNMQVAKRECNQRVVVRQDHDGTFSFHCVDPELYNRREPGHPIDLGREISLKQRFRVASKEDWKKYDTYLNK